MKNIGRFFFNVILVAVYVAVTLRWVLTVRSAIALSFERHPILCGLLIACQLIPQGAVLTLFVASILRNIEFE